MILFMYRITLTAYQRQELQQRTRKAGLPSSTRDRLEMVRLSDSGWSVPRIARHLAIHEQTVRLWIKAFINDGFDALTNKPRGGDTSAVTPAMLEAARAEIVKSKRTWSASQVADWIAEHYGVRIGPGRMRVHLARAGLSYQRTSRSLHHKQKPDEVAERKAQLQELEKRGPRA